MDTWHRKTIGSGPPAYAELRRLRGLRETLICRDRSPYLLAIDVVSGDTVVFIKPQHTDLAAAFFSTPCAEPHFQAENLLALPYEPLPVNSKDALGVNCWPAGRCNRAKRTCLHLTVQPSHTGDGDS